MNIRLWGLLTIIIIAFGSLSWYLSIPPPSNRVPLKIPDGPPKMADPDTSKIKNATREPGRVVTLNTTRGKIEFVMYEKDCPKTAERISKLVQAGAYTGVSFPRVENWVIQTDLAKKKIAPMGLELAKGLRHGKGAVGIARTSDVNSNSSVIYITLDPAYNLDLQYTNFGQVINGIDVATKMKRGDVIKNATIRPLTEADRKQFYEVLKIEAERRTQ